MSKDKDENLHGYRWSDGTVRHHPEPLREKLREQPDAAPVPKEAPRAPTPEQYARAYAEWVREFAAWRAKCGSKE